MSSAHRGPGLTLMVLLVFVVSWAGMLPMIAQSRGWAIGFPGFGLLQLLMLFGPGLVAVGVTAARHGRPGVVALLRRFLSWRLGASWWAAVLMVPLLLCLSAVGLHLLLGGALPRRLDAAGVLPAFLQVLLPYLLLNSEEIAWRGYVLPRLQARWDALTASLILGAVWGLFHLPLFALKGGHPAGYGLPGYLLFLVLLTILFTWIYNGTQGSLLAAHLFHQSLNAWAEAVPFFPRAAGSQRPFGMAVCVAALLVAAIVVYAGRDSLARNRVRIRAD